MKLIILICSLFGVAFGFTRELFDNETNCIGMKNVVAENFFGFKICCNEDFSNDDVKGETQYPDINWEDAIGKEYEAIVMGKTNCTMIGTYPIKGAPNLTI